MIETGEIVEIYYFVYYLTYPFQTSKKGLKFLFNRGLFDWLLLPCPSILYMVKRCAWGTCKTDSFYPERLIKNEKVINFHHFSSEKKFKERRELWIRSCSRTEDFKCTKDSYICSLHFVGENGPTEIQILFQLQLVVCILHVYKLLFIQ